MIIYIRCVSCRHQQKTEGRSFGCPSCPKCGGDAVDMKIGSKPDWWVENMSESEAARALTGDRHDQ